jgi:virginiamycin B lyase
MRYRRSVVLAIAVLAMSAITSSASAMTIAEHSSGLSAEAAPLSIVSGPGESLWFTESGSKLIGRITSAGAISSYGPSGSSAPRSIIVGPDGNLWFTADGGTGEVETLNPQTGVFHEDPLPASSTNPAGLTVGSEGWIWVVVEGSAEAEIDLIIPASGEVLYEAKVPAKNSKPTDITVGPEGDLWFTERGNPGAIGRLNKNTLTISEYHAGLTENSSPTGITKGPEGDIWFTETTPGRIGRLDPTTGLITEFSEGLTVGAPENIVTGSDGNLYFTESAGNGAVGEITPAGAITEYSNGLALNTEPWGITTAPGGTLWFTTKGNPAAIGTLTGSSPGPESVTTTPPPTPSPLPTVSSSRLAEAAIDPVLGRVAGVKPVSGTVLLKTGSGFVPVSGAENVPVGATIDASNGALELITALPHGKTQAATVWGGVFRVSQSPSGNGTTNLDLRGALSCNRHGRAHASAKKPASRRLWAKDNHGHYRSYGSYSATTVLGTEWETLDTCAGTLTRVAQGKVLIRDLRRHRTVVVSASHSYLARA